MTVPAAPAPPAAASAVFGDRLPLVEIFAGRLAGPGVERGLIGPRETAALWTRHLLNCAAVADLIPQGVRVVDVGSGAGLPGLVLALRRSDLAVDLVEPLARRCAFLEETVSALGLADRVRVVRGRAEDATVVAAVGSADVATARAVAPLVRLVRWTLPLVRPRGVLLALKGSRAEDEVEEARSAIVHAGGSEVAIVPVGEGAAATRVVRVVRGSRTPRGERSRTQ